MWVINPNKSSLLRGEIMCIECRQTPCHPRCPNAPEPKVRGRCEQCGEELREDYEYYTDNKDNKFCSDDCVKEYHGIKSKEWDYKEEEW